jgi:hypothetical protein
MGEACSIYRRQMYAEFWQGNLKKRDHFEGFGVEGRIILKWILNKQGQLCRRDYQV